MCDRPFDERHGRRHVPVIPTQSRNPETWRGEHVISQLKFVGGAAAIFLCAFVFASSVGSQEPEGNFGVGVPEVFIPKYLAYRNAQLAAPNPHVMRVPLGYVKGLSTNFTRMAGEMTVNLETGAYTTSLSGLTPLTTYAVWLVDRSESGLIPPPPDLVSRLTTFLAVGPTALLSGNLGLGSAVWPHHRPHCRDAWHPVGRRAAGRGDGERLPEDIFQAFIARERGHRQGPLHRNHTATQPLCAGTDLAAETDDAAFLCSGDQELSHAGARQLLFAAAQRVGGIREARQADLAGADLFFNETFKGNGRTCGTCHPSNNNFTIDPPFIATLPANDPLFVAEFNPVLAGLERPLLMRSHGLILENVDGLEDPTVKFVMRGVPHTLGMQVSLTQDTTQVPTPAEMTGWSGDGAPATGSLRDFAIGAVTQHFTKRLNRVAGH